MVEAHRMSKKDIRRARLMFWAIWTIAISMPGSLLACLLNGSWWSSPVIMTVSTVIGFNYCEWLIKRRQWKADNTIVMCYCGHAIESHGATYDMDRACYYDPTRDNQVLGYTRTCLCRNYTPRFWQMSGRT